MRFNEDGSRDTTFGQSGIASVDLSSSDDIAYGMAELNDGRILLAGQMTDPAFKQGARYHSTRRGRFAGLHLWHQRRDGDAGDGTGQSLLEHRGPGGWSHHGLWPL